MMRTANSPASSGTENAAKNPHTLQIDRRNHAIVTGVEDVFSFQEQEIVLKIDSGEMILTGQNLHIAKLLLEEGQLNIDGRIDGVLYQTAKREERRRFFRKTGKSHDAVF